MKSETKGPECASHIIRTPHGAFCIMCQSPLSAEEEDFWECDACGGDGIGGEDDD
ncbi:hypothetical protein [Teichococcus oryzae]|uniref:hypothetical protein n=1 Tax=Teichococcus oryzae TaxID=1608942 RepID=UPI001375DF41|nr:hypothetical protein [Pseudoroseomonas oryzae]